MGALLKARATWLHLHRDSAIAHVGWLVGPACACGGMVTESSLADVLVLKRLRRHSYLANELVFFSRGPNQTAGRSSATAAWTTAATGTTAVPHPAAPYSIHVLISSLLSICQASSCVDRSSFDIRVWFLTVLEKVALLLDVDFFARSRVSKTQILCGRRSAFCLLSVFNWRILATM